MCTGEEITGRREKQGNGLDPIFPRPFSYNTNNSGLQADTGRAEQFLGSTLPLNDVSQLARSMIMSLVNYVHSSKCLVLLSEFKSSEIVLDNVSDI